MPCDWTRFRYGDSPKYDGVGKGSSEFVQFALVNTLDLRTGKYDRARQQMAARAEPIANVEVASEDLVRRVDLAPRELRRRAEFVGMSHSRLISW